MWYMCRRFLRVFRWSIAIPAYARRSGAVRVQSVVDYVVDHVLISWLKSARIGLRVREVGAMALERLRFGDVWGNTQ